MKMCKCSLYADPCGVFTSEFSLCASDPIEQMDDGSAFNPQLKNASPSKDADRMLMTLCQACGLLTRTEFPALQDHRIYFNLILHSFFLKQLLIFHVSLKYV